MMKRLTTILITIFFTGGLCAQQINPKEFCAAVKDNLNFARKASFAPKKEDVKNIPGNISVEREMKRLTYHMAEAGSEEESNGKFEELLSDIESCMDNQTVFITRKEDGKRTTSTADDHMQIIESKQEDGSYRISIEYFYED